MKNNNNYVFLIKCILLYMKKNAEADKPFTLNAHVRERLMGRRQY